LISSSYLFFSSVWILSRNLAILDYLVSEGDKFAKSISAFQEEANVELGSESGKGMLEKKWTAVIRLQKKVLELEGKLSAVGDSNDGRSHAPREDSKLLPKGPPRSTMSGHRGPITSVAAHPVYRYGIVS
jgi:platelet-activating factor acetylhydrolase IB subunit alpha